jgi:hypothetical protein
MHLNKAPYENVSSHVLCLIKKTKQSPRSFSECRWLVDAHPSLPLNLRERGERRALTQLGEREARGSLRENGDGTDLSRDKNGTDIFRPYSRPNPFRKVLIRCKVQIG